MNKIDDKIYKDMSYRKNFSIAFFNATNSAIALCTGMNVYEEATIKKVFELRDLFLEEHKNYYATVIANIGQNYKADESIAKLKAGTTKEELNSIWLSFSEDERRDGQILKVAHELNKTL